jgi:hypothetical protein
MTQETIDHGTLARLVEAGAVRGARVVGQKGGWSVLVQYGLHERPLAAQRSRQVRVWRKFETLVGYLREIGIAKFDVNAANYDPDQAHASKRPDRAEALRRAHEAAEHDQWFRTEVQAAVIEADDPATQWVSHEEAKADWAQVRAELLGGRA